MQGYPTWSEATWGDRIEMVAVQCFVWGIIFPAMLLGSLFFLGMMADGITEHKTDLARCQKKATTPYEYHQCR